MTADKEHFRHRAAAVSAMLLIAAAPQGALAQASSQASNPLAGLGDVRHMTETVVVKSIDPATRHLVVSNAAGETEALKAPAAFRNFDQLKPGDRISATYTIETEFVLSQPNAPLPADTETTIAGRAAKGELPAGVVANHIVVSGAIVGIDQANHTLKVVSPQGGQVHTIDIARPAGRKAMTKLKVGDKVTAYITESLLISTKPA